MALHKNEITKAVLLKKLIEGICKVTFIKRDGSTRVAFCTLNSDLIPAKFEKSIEKIFLPDANEEILPFWDVTQGKWKSFYVNSVEMFLTADELKKQNPGIQDSQQDSIDGKTNADEIQDMDDNHQDKVDAAKAKASKMLDKDDDEYTIDPINRKNIKRHGHRKNTKSNITKKYEQQKKNLENARNIINALRANAQKKGK